MKNRKVLIITLLLVIIIIFANSGRFIKSTEIYKCGNRDSYGEGIESPLDLRKASDVNPSLLWYSQTGLEAQTVAISSDGNYIISGSRNYTSNQIRFYHKSSSQPLWVNNDVKGVVFGVDISSDGSYMVAGTGYTAGQGTLIYLFEKNSNIPLWSYYVGEIVFSVAISSDGNYIAAGSRDDRVFLFHRQSSTPIWSYIAGGLISSVDISSDGNYIVAGSFDHNVYLFHRSSSTPIWNHTVDHIPGNAGDVETVSISSDGSYIVAGTQIYEGTSQVYLFHRSNYSPIWKYASGKFINSVSISANGEYLVAGGDDKKVFLFQRSSSSPLWSFTAFSSISSVSISADGNYIVAGGYLWDQTVYFFNRTHNTPFWKYITNDIVNSVAISSNGGFSVAGSEDENVYMFKLTDSQNPLPPKILSLIPMIVTSVGIGFVVLLGLCIFIVIKKSNQRARSPSISKVIPKIEEKHVLISDQVKFCPFCGFRIKNTHRFCVNCGASLQNI